MTNPYLRKYEVNTEQHKLYSDMYKNQTISFVNSKKNEYKLLNKRKMSIKTAINLLDSFIDPSDPDLDVPNSIHAYQTAERIRAKYPEDKELQIIGLIHDLGKVLFNFGEPSWAVVGDTYVLGWKFPKSIVYYEDLNNSPDLTNTNLYNVGCGISNLCISFGHDEYLYLVLKGNTNHKISDKYLNVIRFHSFYPWHSKGEYQELMTKEDSEILKDVKKFNEFDLYSKEDSKHISYDIKKYYDDLLDNFFDGDLNW